jgi:hypothetical protein
MQLKIGILVVGSLDWESKCYPDCHQLNFGKWKGVAKHRQDWRTDRLTNNECHVQVPIRYGRCSESRAWTYTMVFSPEYGHRQGKAKIIECKRRVTEFGELKTEATELWWAEGSGRGNRTGAISASWGRVVLIKPHSFLSSIAQDPKELRDRQELLTRWAGLPASTIEFSAGDRAAVASGAPINDGCLQIAWPSQVNERPADFDLLLATATLPQVNINGIITTGVYPDITMVANAWRNSSGDAYYFWFNRLRGICTDDDDEIARRIAKPPGWPLQEWP